MSDLISFDAGAGAVKTWTGTAGVEIPSQVAVDGQRIARAMMGLRKAKPPMQVAFPGGEFFVGSGAHDWGRAVENLDYDRLTGTPEMRALFYAALTGLAAGPQPLDLNVIVGLPIEAMGPETVTALKEWMLGEHKWATNDTNFSATVLEVRCTSQPVGALFDYLLDDEGHFYPERKRAFRGEVGIISIGHSTVELLGVRDRTPVQKWTVGVTLGVQRLLDIVRGDASYSRGELDQMLRLGKLDTRTALPIWSSEVIGHLEHQWGRDWKRFEAVIVVGGGAILLRDQVEHKFGTKVFIPDQPVMAIARRLSRLRSKEHLLC
jgi:hypothetical protein